MTGVLVVCHDGEVTSNYIQKQLCDAKGDILSRKIDSFFVNDVKDGYFVSDMDDIAFEDDFDAAVEHNVNLYEWVITIVISTKDINVYVNGVEEL